ncbi:cell wall assembly protein [Aeromonas veronii]|uniref:SMI1/KNR4 family protein n=1 Tax=Aeromonas veronii TaxID=654 RepID=UPI000C28602A|nr:SMI1/KNR4 family protein [Aeromonas veronii]ATY82043.1 cell wall assembly protein [Aeromonas veronii]
MTIEKQDLVNWEWGNKDLSSIVDERKIHFLINRVEQELSIKLPVEYRDFISFTDVQGPWVQDNEKSSLLAKYNHATVILMMLTFFSTEGVIDHTKLLQESIYDHRTLLPNGLIVIAKDCDDDADAYLIYDVREDSATYQHIFHWRYYVDNLVVGDGLGFVARSLKEFLHMPTSEDNL